MAAAEGTVYMTYLVDYVTTRPGHRDGYRDGRAWVVLITGYTVFEDIRKILAIRRGLKPEEITVTSLTLTTPDEAPTN